MKNFFRKLVVIVAAMTMGLGVLFGFTACNTNTLVVYTESGFAPFEYVSGGEIVGVDVDIMNLVGEKLGMTVKFENVNFDTIVDAVAKGQLCNVGAAGISVTEERKEKVAFSKEYYTAKLYVIYKADNESDYLSTTTDNVSGVYWDSLAGKTVAVQSGTTADLFLSDEIAEGGILDGTNAKPTRFSSLATATADVVSGSSNVLIIDELPAQKLTASDPSLKCAPLYYKGGEGEDDEAAVDVYAICVTKGEDAILNAINEVLDELGSEGIEKLVQKHLGIDN